MEKRNPLVSLNQVTKHYPLKKKSMLAKRKYLKAVNGVTVDIYEQETLGVVGESGCGKSTLGRTILRLEKLDAGTINFQGENLQNLDRSKQKSVKKEMQMIFQDPYGSLDPRQKIGSLLQEPMKIHTNYSKAEMKQRVDELLEEVGLKPMHVSKFPHEFSGGQRQRIGIARALTLNPRFIVCDEAVSALDVSVQAQVIKLLQRLQEKHELTYMFISHDLGVVRYISDRVLVMYLGHMAELAPTNRLFETPRHPYTQALLTAIPSPNLNKRRERIKLKGDGVNQNYNENGCPFEPRCPLATAQCKEEVPAWREIDADHYVACHHA